MVKPFTVVSAKAERSRGVRWGAARSDCTILMAKTHRSNNRNRSKILSSSRVQRVRVVVKIKILSWQAQISGRFHVARRLTRKNKVSVTHNLNSVRISTRSVVYSLPPRRRPSLPPSSLPPSFLLPLPFVPRSSAPPLLFFRPFRSVSVSIVL